MGKLGYVRALDGLRGVAIAMVVAYHFFGLPGGFYGVDVFFVLSGFLITTLLIERQDRITTFYVRRVRRLLPAVAALVLAVFTLYALVGRTEHGLSLAVLGGTYAANIVLDWRDPVLALMFAVGLTVASYRYIERPFRQWRTIKQRALLSNA